MSSGHLVSVVANGVNSKGIPEEWIVVCYTKGCDFEWGPNGDLDLLREFCDWHRDQTRE